MAEGDVLKKETCRTGNSKEEAEQKGAKLVEVVEKHRIECNYMYMSW